MGRSADQYKQMLWNLLPPGRAFVRGPDREFNKLFDAMSQEYSRIDCRTIDLINEANPISTLELLSDWERVAGLPDDCDVVPETIQDRRSALLAKLASQGGQSPQYFIDVAAAMGVPIEIVEYQEFKAGFAAAGDPLTNGDWVYYWMIIAPGTEIRSFSAGQSAAGERLATWGNELLECKMNELKPSHTQIIFAYNTNLLLEDGGALLIEDGGFLLLE